VRPRRAAEQGAALLIVLWMLLILSLLAAAFLATTRSDLAIARNEVESAKARELADAGVSRAVLALVDGNPQRRWRADGTRYVWRFGGGTVALRIVAETGKIDLNAAPEAVLLSLFRHAGAGEDASARLAEEAVARRVPAPQIVTAGGPLTIDPGEPGFAAIEDLGALPGMAAPVLHQALPLVTVYSGAPTVDPATAPREVLLALPGASEADVDQFIAARDAQAAGAGPALAPPSSLAPYLAAATPRALTITADARTDTGGRFVREALVLLNDPQGRPFVVKRWAQALAPE
jgi:general secretion pathway protein K